MEDPDISFLNDLLSLTEQAGVSEDDFTALVDFLAELSSKDRAKLLGFVKAGDQKARLARLVKLATADPEHRDKLLRLAGIGTDSTSSAAGSPLGNLMEAAQDGASRVNSMVEDLAKVKERVETNFLKPLQTLFGKKGGR